MSKQQQTQVLAAYTEAAWIKSVLDSAQRFASAWALIGSPLDDGTASDSADAARTELHSLLCFSPAAALLQRMLSPSDLGHAVSAEVRDLVRQVLGMQAVEKPATCGAGVMSNWGQQTRQALELADREMRAMRATFGAGLLTDKAIEAVARALAMPSAQPEPGMVSVTHHDANAYSRILAVLGLEEEGDAVAEVQKLLAENEQLRTRPGLRRVPVIPADVLNMVDRPAGTTGGA